MLQVICINEPNLIRGHMYYLVAKQQGGLHVKFPIVLLVVMAVSMVFNIVSQLPCIAVITSLVSRQKHRRYVPHAVTGT